MCEKRRDIWRDGRIPRTQKRGRAPARYRRVFACPCGRALDAYKKRARAPARVFAARMAAAISGACSYQRFSVREKTRGYLRQPAGSFRAAKNGATAAGRLPA